MTFSNLEIFQMKNKFIDETMELYKPCITQCDINEVYNNYYIPHLHLYKLVDQKMINANIQRRFKLKSYNQKQLDQDIINQGGLCNFNIIELKEKLKIVDQPFIDDDNILRFFSKFAGDTKETIWLWNGTVHNSGYGQIRHGKKQYLPHRIIFELCFFDIPFIPDTQRKFHICHSCDTPLCCNIFHLWIGDTNDNGQDMLQKNRNFLPNYILSIDEFDDLITDIKNDKYKNRQEIVDNYNGRFTYQYLTGRFNRLNTFSNKYTNKEIIQITNNHLDNLNYKFSSNIKDLIFTKILNKKLTSLSEIEKEFNISRPTLLIILFKEYDQNMNIILEDQIKALKMIIYRGLNWNDVYNIRFIQFQQYSNKKLAKIYNVGESTISAIIKNNVWKHVTKENINSTNKKDFKYGQYFL